MAACCCGLSREFLHELVIIRGSFGHFFITHSLPVRPKIKSRFVGMLGPHGFTLAYSILSIAMLSWLITAAASAAESFKIVMAAIIIDKVLM